MSDHRAIINFVLEEAKAKELESELDLPDGWVLGFFCEDDWSFVIKAHALLESAANIALEVQLDRDGLSDFIARLEFSGGNTGKINLLCSLGVLDSECKRFCQKLSELRNRFVHDVKMSQATIKTFLDGLHPSDKKGFLKAFQWGVSDIEKFNWGKIESEEAKTFYSLASHAWGHNEKLSIWLGVLFMMKVLKV